MTKLSINFSGQFKRDLKLVKKQHKNIDKVFSVIEKLANQEALPESFCDHNLQGKYSECRECHVEPDLLIIYEVFQTEQILLLLRIGSHSKLF